MDVDRYLHNNCWRVQLGSKISPISHIGDFKHTGSIQACQQKCEHTDGCCSASFVSPPHSNGKDCWLHRYGPVMGNAANFAAITNVCSPCYYAHGDRTSQGTCPVGWTGPAHGSCYFGFGIQFRNRQSARIACKALDIQADLVSIHSPAENELVRKIRSNTDLSAVQNYHSWRPSVWIGYSDQAVEGSWVWSDRTLPASFPNWDQGQPDNYKGNQDCAVMWKDAGKWDDASCGWGGAAAICKMPAMEANEAMCPKKALGCVGACFDGIEECLGNCRGH